MNVDDVILERRSTHGPFQPQFAFAQTLKLHWRSTPNWDQLSGVQREVLEMVATKISRILYGNPHEPDHFADMAGYARLAELSLLGLSDQAEILREPATETAQHTSHDQSWADAANEDALTMQEQIDSANAFLDRPPHPLDNPDLYAEPIGPKKVAQLPRVHQLRGVPNKEDIGINLQDIEREVERELRSK